MIERLQRMIARGSADFHSGSYPSQHIKSRTLVEELTRLTDPKVATQYVVRNIHIFPIKYAHRKEAKGQEWETRETRTEEPATARAGVAGLSTSQERADSADEDTGRPELPKPFTNEQDKQIAVFFGHHPCFYDMSHPDYKNKNKRRGLVLQFAQSMFTSGKCVLSFIFNVEPVVFL